MIRILFVDDDPKVLRGLRRLLLSAGSEWTCEFVDGGAKALAVLESHPVDVLVTDMRMPGMDGATLLQRVRERFPRTIRIALSGHTDREAVLRAAPVTHQFLSKPCDPAELREVISRAVRLVNTMHNPELRNVIASIVALPPMPEVHVRLTRALLDQDSSVDDVAFIVEHDAAITSKLLQLVNSSFFGVTRRVADVRTAVSTLGIEAVRQIMLTLDVFDAARRQGQIDPETLRAYHAHAQECARLATELLDPAPCPGTLWTTAVLHDIGELVLHQAGTAGSEKSWDPERSATAGAMLLDLWGLPLTIIEAVAFHRRPSQCAAREIGVLAAIHVANAVLEARDAGHPPSELAGRADLDHDYLKDALGERVLNEWLETAVRAIDASASAGQRADSPAFVL